MSYNKLKIVMDRNIKEMEDLELNLFRAMTIGRSSDMIDKIRLKGIQGSINIFLKDKNIFQIDKTLKKPIIEL